MIDVKFATFSEILLVHSYLLVLQQYLSYHAHGLTTTSIYKYILPYGCYQAPPFYPDSHDIYKATVLKNSNVLSYCPTLNPLANESSLAMCIKILTRCCHCGEPLTPYFIACNAWRVAALRADREYLDLPRASECEYLEQEIKPVLSGCPNNNTCPSWFGNLLRGFGDHKNEDREIQSARDNVAWEKYNELEANFACKYFAKKPIPPRQEPESFRLTMLRDCSADDQSSNPALILDSEADHEGSAESSDYGCSPAVHMQYDEANSGESAEIDPEDLFLGDLLTKRSEGDGSQSPVTRTTGEGYQDLVVPVWNAFYPAMDLSRDGEFCD
jgi:hypothetical protein